jgi:hypothetical protein
MNYMQENDIGHHWYDCNNKYPQLPRPPTVHLVQSKTMLKDGEISYVTTIPVGTEDRSQPQQIIDAILLVQPSNQIKKN